MVGILLATASELSNLLLPPPPMIFNALFELVYLGRFEDIGDFDLDVDYITLY